MKQNITDNGKRIYVKDMVHIITQMVIDTKVIGTMIFKMVLVLIIILMVIFIKVNGSMVSQMGKAIISIIIIKESIKEIGRMVRRKDSGSWLLMINMVILVIGRKIKRMAKVHTFTPMAKDMKEIG